MTYDSGVNPNLAEDEHAGTTLDRDRAGYDIGSGFDYRSAHKVPGARLPRPAVVRVHQRLRALDVAQKKGYLRSSGYILG